MPGLHAYSALTLGGVGIASQPVNHNYSSIGWVFYQGSNVLAHIGGVLGCRELSNLTFPSIAGLDRTNDANYAARSAAHRSRIRVTCSFDSTTMAGTNGSALAGLLVSRNTGTDYCYFVVAPDGSWAIVSWPGPTTLASGSVGGSGPWVLDVLRAVSGGTHVFMINGVIVYVGTVPNTAAQVGVAMKTSTAPNNGYVRDFYHMEMDSGAVLL